MRFHRMMVIGVVAIAAGATVATAALSRSARRIGPPATRDPAVPAVEQDNGKGEKLLLVVGGAFPTREEAEAANAAISLGEMQGFYVASTTQFPGLQERLGQASGEYVLVSAFRTGRGAKEFLDLVQASGAPAFLTPRLENLGYEYVGLGQEADPDGVGPLTEPVSGLST